MARRYLVVDAFSARPLMGNPVAVILDAEGLGSEQMQAIARWTNLSETTFVLPATTPDADYRLRIFTPASELAFAGHPTLGSARAVIDSGWKAPLDGKLVQECKAGLIDISLDADDGQLTLQLPAARITPLPDTAVQALSRAYGAPLAADAAFAAVDVGIVWGVAEIESVEALLAMRHDLNLAAEVERQNDLTGVSLFARYDDGSIEVRSFAVSDGVPEDPVCGSGNGAIAAYRRHLGQLPHRDWSYLSRQGRCVGRDGTVHLSADSDGHIRVGGQCVITARGQLEL
ncbi:MULTISPECIES: PhzF family phenazine biosynthesis protein [unclassified Brevundimonas]|uniref:PhzF family phenazine biosynthesis protein n=1 Tax=unclassified Brevundimonas TaxID=2622653 RepID=UPI0025B9D234|nr:MULTISPECIES: PhzF family phenazine biosynthesis protein [unclassified Brevundimonas]